MHKILYAINHRQTEEAIDQRVSHEYLQVGAVTYKEAVLEQLKNTGADTLLIRESLPGSTPVERLLNRTRVEYPNLRIIIICNERPKQDPFLQMLVNLAIYDIINSDRTSISEICSYILTPRTYRDAAQYGIGLPNVPGGAPKQPTPPPAPAEPEPKKEDGFFDNLKKGFSMFKKPASPPTTPTKAPDQPTPRASTTVPGDRKSVV